ncbi:MAG: amino acid adenylation domain-containing protein, partial [bacterium]|nr:amino acid adenylation domain-containing protein [bacterium]
TLENIYGPTEATIYAASYSLTQWDGTGPIPIGKPEPNLKLYILDKHERIQPVGVPGELCIAGVGVTRGYLNRPELTAERFIKTSAQLAVGSRQKEQSAKEPEKGHQSQQKLPALQIKAFGGVGTFSRKGSDPPEASLYRTGDLCCWQPDGNIEYLGRMDFQVKIRGFRIELGELESHLLKHENVKEAVVIAREEKGGGKYLCAYIVPI